MCDLMDLWGKTARERYYMMKVVLRELAMDSYSYMEPEDDDFLPDGDDFVAKSSDVDMSDELVLYTHVFLLKTVWKMFVYKIILFSVWLLFCYHDDNMFMYTRTNLRLEYKLNIHSFVPSPFTNKHTRLPWLQTCWLVYKCL